MAHLVAHRAPSDIGHFIIGVSPIGVVPGFDWWITVISQYANSPTLLQLIENFWTYTDQARNFAEFYDLIWNVDTAQGEGLDIWGRIVGVGRVVAVQVSIDNFGLTGSTGHSGEPFNQAPFYTGATLTQNYALSDDAYRLLIMAKAATNISDGSTASINAILMGLFPGRGNAYVKDLGGMAMAYHFDFPLSDVELAVISQSGALPKPTGVLATVETA